LANPPAPGQGLLDQHEQCDASDPGEVHDSADEQERHQHILLEGQLAAGDLPRPVDAAQDILPPADIKIFFALRPTAVNDEVGISVELLLSAKNVSRPDRSFSKSAVS
jgi:hypothetical protein